MQKDDSHKEREEKMQDRSAPDFEKNKNQRDLERRDQPKETDKPRSKKTDQ
jgi:hypothetical protein